MALITNSPGFWQLGFQCAGSSIMEEVNFFHDQIMFILIIILTAVLGLIFRTLSITFSKQGLIEGAIIEIVWTLIPAIILIFIAFPSLKLLYLIEEESDSELTIKAIGHQWYWWYEYSDYEDSPDFESYVVPTTDLKKEELRLLEADTRLVVPVAREIRILVTAADVLHSFAVPSLAVKLDAIPGRLNQTNLVIKRPGVFYGQCSELCGANHSFMPIVIEAVSLQEYGDWIESIS